MSATQFSYAQAARGQVSSPAAAQMADSNHGLAAESVTSSAQSTTPSTALSTVSNDVDSAADPTQSQSGQSDLANQVALESDVQNSKEEDTTSVAASVQQPSTQPLNEKKQSPDNVSQGNDRRPRGTTSSARGTDVTDAKKPGKRNNKKSRGNEKDSEPEQVAEKEKEVEEPKVALADAPLPVVNPWTRRAEAQATKVKTSPSPAVAPQSSNGLNKPSQIAGSTPSNVDSRSTRLAPSNGVEGNGQHMRMTNGAKAQKKASESARDGSRPVPRGNRAGDKNAKDVADPLPAVSDPSSWPTPETAATEVKPQEKDEVKDDNKSDTGANQKTKWVQIPFVPTVNFTTPINRGTGRGGSRGGSRGGREAGARASNAASTGERNNSGHKNAGDKSADAGSNGPSKRASVDGTMGSRDVRKSLGTSGDATKALTGVSQINGKAEPFKPSQGAQSSSASDQHQGIEAPKGTANKFEQGPRVSEGQKDPSHQGTKNFQNGRGEGGRRGGARGRGGHSNANSQSHHHGYPPNGQHFAGPNMAGPNMAGRQNPYAANLAHMGYGAPYPGMNQAAGHRGSNRSQSGTSNSYNQRGPANGSRSYRPPPINNAAFDPMMAPNGLMPMAAPYYPSEPGSLLDLVMTQLEYYFSVDNLCKDTWLREHMDSQGYVKLDLIRDFKRIKRSTQDINLLRFACEQAHGIEYVIGDDQQERIRRKANWEDWVLPVQRRHVSVGSDPGPQNVYVPNRHSYNAYAPHMMPAHYPMEHQAVFSPSYMEHPYPPYMNGFSYGPPRNPEVGDAPNGQAAPGGSRLSANVPEFSPSTPMAPADAQFSDQGRPSLKQSKQTGEVATTNGEAAPTTNGASENGVPHTNGAGDSAAVESQ
ncbi:La domain family [Apiospora rasikravindrae]|uniref:La domain family n=1 Tax=Apiospora rasikravindrae TaxID=990691 RepID=A0ABR1UBI6_9PEZI